MIPRSVHPLLKLCSLASDEAIMSTVAARPSLSSSSSSSMSSSKKLAESTPFHIDPEEVRRDRNSSILYILGLSWIFT